MACTRCLAALVFSSMLLAAVTSATAGIYAAPAQRAADWLETQRDVSDGSWGSTAALKQLYTTSVARALQAFNRRSSAYYGGLSWVKNHETGNNDYLARRALVLADTGSSLAEDVEALLTSQRTTLPYNNGWGISTAYNGSPRASALRGATPTTASAERRQRP